MDKLREDENERLAGFLKHPDFLTNPYPFYTKLRALKKPVHLSHDMGTLSDGIWYFSGYQDALAIFKETAKISNNPNIVRTPAFSTPFDRSMLVSDGANHLRLRHLINNYFKSRSVNLLTPLITRIANQLIRDFIEKKTIDLVADFAELLPLTLIAHMVGIPNSDIAQIRAWSLSISQGIDSLVNALTKAESYQAMMSFGGYLKQLISWKQQHFNPDDNDLLSFLVAQLDLKTLDYDELVGLIGFTLFAGHETTVSAIGTGLWLLLNHPEQWLLLQHHNELMPGAVEEILRFESPQQRTSFRITKAPLVIAGMDFLPGQQLSILIGSANRDETIFTDAEHFNIQRQPNPHIAFGVGLHHCLGKHLARLEINIALTCILKQCATIQLKYNQINWRNTTFFRGLTALPASL